MGQMTVGILYGCEAPMMPDVDDEPGAYDLICRWEVAKKIGWTTKGPKIHLEREGGVDLIGVWIAVGASGEDDAPSLKTAFLIHHAGDQYHKRYTQAEKLWNRFAAWTEKTDGLKLPLPKLWLTPAEVA